MDKTSKVYIYDLLSKSDYAVERAMLAIFNRQTMDEQNLGSTIVHNGMGFAAPDARLGSYYARWIISGKRLSGKHLDKARSMSYKYVGQLQKVAQDNLSKAKVEG